MKKQKLGKVSDFSVEALRKFAEIRKIATDAVQSAIEENKKLGIKPSEQFSKY